MSDPRVEMTAELAGHAREVREAAGMVLTRLAEHPGMSKGGQVALKVGCDAIEGLEAQAETIAALRGHIRGIRVAYDQLAAARGGQGAHGVPALELMLSDAIERVREV